MDLKRYEEPIYIYTLWACSKICFRGEAKKFRGVGFRVAENIPSFLWQMRSFDWVRIRRNCFMIVSGVKVWRSGGLCLVLPNCYLHAFFLLYSLALLKFHYINWARPLFTAASSPHHTSIFEDIIVELTASLGPLFYAVLNWFLVLHSFCVWQIQKVQDLEAEDLPQHPGSVLQKHSFSV